MNRLETGNTMKKASLTALLLALFATTSQAVHISPRGIGQVLIYPYYTAQKFDPATNASLNTTYSIVNTTGDAKAVKVRFLEGDNAIAVLEFNIYLSAYDVWAGVTGAKDNSYRPGHIGGAHRADENTCASFINPLDGYYGTIEDFNPFLIETLDGVSAAEAVTRTLDGHFIAIEMGTLNETDAALVDHGITGLPSGCQELENRWRVPDGAWLTGDATLGPVSGGLYGGATILDVVEGYAISYEAIALEDFWGDDLQGQHTKPGDFMAPSLSDAAPLSRVIKDQAFDASGTYDGGGYVLTTHWPTGRGIDAVSALFMTSTITNEYVFDAARNAKTEWVITFPTKHHYVAAEPTAPFSNVWDGEKACDNYKFSIWDREEQVASPLTCDPVSDPIFCPPVICYDTNVAEFLRPGEAPNISSEILGSDNRVFFVGPALTQATASGWATIRFEEPTMVLTGGEGASFRGLPAVGFMLQRYTNAAAQPGLLAQYAAAFKHVTAVDSF